jgi:hypothetical protein
MWRTPSIELAHRSSRLTTYFGVPIPYTEQVSEFPVDDVLVAVDTVHSLDADLFAARIIQEKFHHLFQQIHVPQFVPLNNLLNNLMKKKRPK